MAQFELDSPTLCQTFSSRELCYELEIYLTKSLLHILETSSSIGSSSNNCFSNFVD